MQAAPPGWQGVHAASANSGSSLVLEAQACAVMIIKKTHNNRINFCKNLFLSMRLIIRSNGASVAEWVSRYVVKRIKDFAPTAEVRHASVMLSEVFTC
jgi:hypothetical protein